MRLPTEHRRKIKERLTPYVKDAQAVDLLDKLFKLNPTERLDADEALNHDFFWSDPMPCELTKMMSKLTSSMFEYHSHQRLNVRRHNQQLVNAKPNDNSYQDRVY